MTLMRTDAPREDESGFGYYRRLSANNALWSWRELAALANVARTRAALLGSPDHVAVQLGLDAKWTQAAARQEELSRSWRGLRRVHGDAVCPHCLADESYVRLHWEHAFVTACPVHRVRLIDRCGACGQALSANRERIEQCACGHDLRTTPTVACSDAQQWLCALIASGGHSTGGIAPRLGVVEVGMLCDLVRTLCLLANPQAAPPRRNSVSPKSVAEAVELLAVLEDLLADWPRGFEGHVALRIAAGPAGARTLNRLLGQWYGHVKRAGQTKGLRPFLEAVVRVAARDFDGALGLDTAEAVATRVTGYLRVAEAAKAAGVGRDQLLGAVKAGLVKHRTRRFGTRGLVYEVTAAEVERIRRSRAQWIGEAEACELADVTLSVLRNIVAARVIAAEPGWRADVFKGGPIDRASLDDLLVRLNKAAVMESAPGEVLSWSELTSRRMGDKQAIQAVMQAASCGRLHPLRKAKTVGQVQFRRDAVMPYFGTPVLEAGMSVQQLAKATGWKWESISHWMELGLLESTSIALRGQPCRVVAPQHLLQFMRAYLPLADLAHAMGTTSTALADQLHDIEVIGAKPLPNGARRGGLIRIADLGRLAARAATG
jgi:hypothetical protein